MEAFQALKFSSRTSSLNLTEHLLDGFYPQEGGVVEGACELLEAVYDTEADSPHRSHYVFMSRPLYIVLPEMSVNTMLPQARFLPTASALL